MHACAAFESCSNLVCVTRSARWLRAEFWFDMLELALDISTIEDAGELFAWIETHLTDLASRGNVRYSVASSLRSGFCEACSSRDVRWCQARPFRGSIRWLSRRSAHHAMLSKARMTAYDVLPCA